MKSLYKYPQAAFPYEQLVSENCRRSRNDGEFELADTGIFDHNRYFDVFAEYAKASPDDLLIRITIANRGDQESTIHVLPTLWFRKTWSLGCTHEGCELKPSITRQVDGSFLAEHPTLGRFRLHLDRSCCGSGTSIAEPVSLLTENETNNERLFGTLSPDSLTKDAFHDFVISGQNRTVLEVQRGTKAAQYFVATIPAGDEIVLRLRLVQNECDSDNLFGPEFDEVFRSRIQEADDFYATTLPPRATDEECRVARQALAGLMFSKQFYHYAIRHW